MNGAKLLDQQGLDTYLALLLLRRGDLDQPTLEGLLREVRGRRASGATLARTLLQRNLVGQPALEAAFAELVVQETLPSSGPQPAVREQRIGDYRILERLGAGGMGVVHLAEHVETGGRYALKTLHGVQDPEAILRFEREAQGHARTDDHPNVVRVHSFGHYPGGLYLVMDLVSGGSLADRLKTETLTPTESAQIVRDVARGLAHIHACGVLHRDLKPDNILLDGATPKLVDFGLAKVVGEDSLTVSGTVMGTPAYMAPEQVDPTRGEPGPWTDVYGLGAVLYRCLTGSPPFVGGSALAVMMNSLEKDPPAPRSLRAEIPEGLEAICLRALLKAPEQRLRTASDLADELDRFLAGGGQSRRSRGPLLAAAGLLCGALALSAWAIVSPADSPRVATETPPAPTTDTPGAGSTAPDLPPAPETEPALEQPDLPLPFNADLQVMLPQESRLLSNAKALAKRGEHAAAAKIFERLLRDPITGKVRRDPARRLGPLLRDGRGVTANRKRATALLLEAALHQAQEACQDLGWTHLSPDLLRILGSRTLTPTLPPGREHDNVLAAACVRVYQLRNPDSHLHEAFLQVLIENDVPLPSLEEAYEILWQRYAKRYPARARAHISEAPPTLPIPDGPLEDPDLRTYDHARRTLAAENPKQAVETFEALLFDADGRFRSKVARHLGVHLCRGSGVETNMPQGIDLLLESALRGDSDSAQVLCLAYLPPKIRERLDEEFSFLGRHLDVDLEPNPPLAAACAKVYSDKSEIIGNRVLHMLDVQNVPLPKTEAEAYLIVWKHYLGRRRARTD